MGQGAHFLQQSPAGMPCEINDGSGGYSEQAAAQRVENWVTAAWLLLVHVRMRRGV